MNWNKLSIETLDGGRIIDTVDLKIDEMVRDCLDFSKSDEKRVIDLRVTIKPDQDRATLNIEWSTKVKPGNDPVRQSQAFVDPKGNAVVSGVEQLSFDINTKRIDEEKAQ